MEAEMTSIRSGGGRSWALLLALALGGQFLASAGTPEPPSGAEQKAGLAPLVKVVTPTNSFSYVVGQGTGSGARMVLIGIEITDRSGAGIDVNDAGIPKFVNANDNVDAFVRRIVAKGSYIDNLGQTVLQLFAEIPVSGLKVEDDMYVSPPLSVGHLRPKDHKD